MTGASGPVGRAIARRLRDAGYAVRALVHADADVDVAEVARGDLGDRSALAAAAAGVEVAVHCAAVVGDDWIECRRTNDEGTRALVDTLVESGCRRLVHVSTISVYDDTAADAFDEASAIWTEPRDPYGFTKAEAERIVSAAVARGLPSVILRPGVVLSMDRRSRWGPLALERARASTASILPFPEIPHVHAESLAEAAILALEASVARSLAYNVLDGVGDGAEYLQAVYGAIGRDPPPIPPGSPRLRFPAERIVRELGFRPRDRWAEFLSELGRRSCASHQ